MEMCGVCSLVFFVIMGAAKVGCRSSCTRSKSQADNRELPEQNLQHEVNLKFLSQDNMTNYHLNLTWRPTQLLAGSQSNCQEWSPVLLFLGRGDENFPLFIFGQLQADLFSVFAVFLDVFCIFFERG